MAIVHSALALPEGLIESLPGTGEAYPWDGEGALSPMLRGGSKGNSHIRCSAGEYGFRGPQSAAHRDDLPRLTFEPGPRVLSR